MKAVKTLPEWSGGIKNEEGRVLGQNGKRKKEAR